MPLRSLPYREVKRKLEAADSAEASQKGSHVKFVKISAAETLTAIVPRHREISPGTLRRILRQAAISEEVFDQQ